MSGFYGNEEKYERNKRMVTIYLYDDETTMQEIGDVFGITRQAVQRILKKYGVTNARQSRLEKRKNRLYDFIVEYKTKNDGNSPGIHEMRQEANLSTPYRVHGALIALEYDGLITFSNSYTSGGQVKSKVNITGAKWIPPK